MFEVDPQADEQADTTSAIVPISNVTSPETIRVPTPWAISRLIGDAD